MRVKKEIESLDDIKLLVDSFYSKVRKADLLKGIFEGVIEDRWPEHLDKMYRFWETVLLSEHSYHGSPFRPHAKLPVSKEHFDQWKSLFNMTVDEFFVGQKANEAKWRAEKMAEMFQVKIDYYRNKSSSSLL